MSNAAYTESYLAFRQRCLAAFTLENRVERAGLRPVEQQFEEFTLRTVFYEAMLPNCAVHGSDCRLFKNGREIFSWQSVNNDGDFYRLIHHQNGRRYLVFRQDLYGYSVLSLADFSLFQYFPKGSWPEGPEKFQETFIWTDVSYSAETGLLAVAGCFWAAPMEVVCLPFDEPMAEHWPWMMLRDALSDDVPFAGFEPDDDILLAGWQPDGSLRLSVGTVDGKRLLVDCRISEDGRRVLALTVI